MSQVGAQTIATFNGTLLRREHTLGQRFVQLVFRENDKNWLCLSSNFSHTAKLQIGKSYKIEGVFKQLGERPYIHEPHIAPLAREIVKRRVWISLVIGLAVLLTAGGIVLAASHEDATIPPDTHAVQQSSTSSTSDTQDDAPVDTASVPTETTDTPATTTPAPTTAKTNKTTTPAQSQNNAPVNTVVAPVPHCDPIVVTTLTPVITEDPSQSPPYELVTQENIDRQVQTCYPDVGNANSFDKVIVEGQPQEKTVGTLVTPPPTETPE